ncbi:MAG: xanthine dehydrogenase family protein molybdopterin-binding subunit, partial [Alphaproteobacteria bacterium]
DRYVLYTTMQGPHGLRRQLAQRILNIPENSLRVVCNDVGGAFGIKGRTMYREYGLVLWAAREVGRPVKWVADRTESFLGDYHGRDHLSVAELALDRAGNFLALRVSTFAAMGAYLSNVGPSVPASSSAMVVGTYRTPAIAVTVTGVFTNANPTSAYRGAGRPEACYVIERVVDTAAREMGIDPAELRRRNLIAPEAMPYRLPLGGAYDSGEFARNLDQALATADWTGFETRRAAARAQGNLRGIGISSYVERCAGMGDERIELHFDPSGSLSLVVGSMSNGQGHETTFAQMVAAAFGLPIESIRYVQGDTDKVYYGVGTGGSRTALLAGTSVMNGIEKVVAKGRRIAAHMMEAAEADVEFAAGRFTVAGTDRSVTITEVARIAWQANRLPPGMEPGLREAGTFAPSAPTYPNGCHVCEVEIDPATGQTRIVGYTVVDDVGHVINPLLLEGQIHGGIAQGVGQALMEEVRYDPESGQLLTASFMDYCMPRADDLCDFSTAYHEVPCRTNPLGIKGAGEAGTIGALPAVINAVIDALWPIGVRSIDMPATPEAVWRAIRSAEVVKGQ